MGNIDGAVSVAEDNQSPHAGTVAAGGRDAGVALKRELIGWEPNRTADESAVAFAIDAVFGAWASLGIEGDAAKFADHIENAWLLETLETQLKETRNTSDGAAYAFYRDWLTPFRRPPNPADPMSGQIETLKIEASFGEYFARLRKLARGAQANDAAPNTVKAPVTADSAEGASGKRKWFDKTTARGRKERWMLTAILMVFAAVWTHNHWTHAQPSASAADAAQSDDSSN